MSIQNAMQSGVSGLFANSSRMGYVSNNIANSQTIGYKRQFGDMVSVTAGGPSATRSATTVRTAFRMDMETQGTMMRTDIDTDIALVGSGFLVVGQNADPGIANHRLTRAGSFTKNDQGYLVNSAGYYLYGFQYDENGELGAVDRGSFRDLKPVSLGDVNIYGSPTTSISYNANLPAQQTGQPTPPSPFVTSVEYYTALGASERLLFEWQPSSSDNLWTLTVSDADGNAYGRVDVSFHDSGPNVGTPEAYTNITSFTVPISNFDFSAADGRLNLTIPNGDVPQQITIDFGAPGTSGHLSQFVGDYSPEGIRKDGSPSSPLERVEFDRDGTLWGIFAGGHRKPLYDIPIAEVVNAEGLLEEEGSAFSYAHQAGTLTLRKSGTEKGYIAGGTLERSNVDLARELTDLIEIQRSYSSNAKIVQTADEMLDETTRLKR